MVTWLLIARWSDEIFDSKPPKKKAFKEGLKALKTFKTVRKRSEVFWSGKKRSGVEIRSGVLFLLNLAKLIDFDFRVEISTIKRIHI